MGPRRGDITWANMRSGRHSFKPSDFSGLRERYAKSLSGALREATPSSSRARPRNPNPPAHATIHRSAERVTCTMAVELKALGEQLQEQLRGIVALQLPPQSPPEYPRDERIEWLERAISEDEPEVLQRGAGEHQLLGAPLVLEALDQAVLTGKQSSACKQCPLAL